MKSPGSRALNDDEIVLGGARCLLVLGTGVLGVKASVRV